MGILMGLFPRGFESHSSQKFCFFGGGRDTGKAFFDGTVKAEELFRNMPRIW